MRKSESHAGRGRLPHVTWSQDGAHQLQGFRRGGSSEWVERYGGKKRVYMNTFRNKDNSSIAFLKKDRVLSFLLSSKTERYGREMGGHAAKDNGAGIKPLSLR